MGAREFQWHTEMLSWKDAITDPVTCAWGACAPSVLFGRNVNRITDGQTSFMKAALTHLGMGGCCCWCCCLPPYAASYREKLRKKRNLPMDPASDRHAHQFCHPCALCQEERELDALGSAAMVGPKKAIVDRNPEETEKHLEEMHNQQMDR